MTLETIVSDFDSHLAPAERELVEVAREFGRREVEPAAQQWERERRPPTEVLRSACQHGLAGIELSPQYGGLGLRFSAKLRVFEELAKYDFGFAFSLVNHHNATVRVAQARPPVSERLVPKMLRGELIGCAGFTEPDHGSDLAGLETLAKSVDGGWLLEGSKAWITNAAIAGVVVTLAQTNAASGPGGIAAFIVEADQQGFTRESAYALDGVHSAGVGGFRLHRYFASEEAILDPPGSAFKATLTAINGARTYVAAMCAGMLDSCIAHAVQYVSRRKAFGQAVIEFQGLRWSLVDAETDLAALRLLAYRAARQIDAGQNAEEAAARAKKFAGDRVLGHIAACIQAMGANGLRSDHSLMRHLAGCKAACFADGTTEIMNERLGKLLVRNRAQ